MVKPLVQFIFPYLLAMSHLPLADAELQYSRLFFRLLGVTTRGRVTLVTSNITIALGKNSIPTSHRGRWWEWKNGPGKLWDSMSLMSLMSPFAPALP